RSVFDYETRHLFGLNRTRRLLMAPFAGSSAFGSSTKFNLKCLSEWMIEIIFMHAEKTPLMPINISDGLFFKKVVNACYALPYYWTNGNLDVEIFG
ncbi:MAG: hypothetical protein KDD15_26410, partial [Lewinella sp.]|nr:hypothetical protein [Lewinella sp.]